MSDARGRALGAGLDVLSYASTDLLRLLFVESVGAAEAGELVAQPDRDAEGECVAHLQFAGDSSDRDDGSDSA